MPWSWTRSSGRCRGSGIWCSWTRAGTLPGRGLRGASDSLLSRGLVAVSTKKGQQVVISYAAAKGKPALDGEAGGNSPYAAALAAHLVTPGQRLVDLLIKVEEHGTGRRTEGQQEPWPSGSLGEKFYFVPPEPDVIVVNPTKTDGPVEGSVVVNPPPPVVPSWKTDWERLEGRARAGTLRAYIEKYRDVDGAEVWVADAEELLAEELAKPPPPPLPGSVRVRSGWNGRWYPSIPASGGEFVEEPAVDGVRVGPGWAVRDGVAGGRGWSG